MLDELVVRNLALIEEARIFPGRGLVVVSGETGTGKTVLLGALRLLMGLDARPDLVGPFGDEAVVEGRFVVDDEELAVSRRIPRDGRSRSYLNGAIASTQVLAERLSGTVEIVGQHDQLTLTRPAEIRRLLDGMLDEKGRVALNDYRLARNRWLGVEEARRALGGDKRALARELELTRFQAEEIAAAGFSRGDDQTLAKRASRLANAEALALHLAGATQRSDSASESVGFVVDELRKASRIDPDLGPLVENAESLAETLLDLTRALRIAEEGVNVDPQELAEVDARLTMLGDFRRKYGDTLDEILAFGEMAAKRSADLTSLLQQSETIDGEADEALKATEQAGRALREARSRSGKRLAKAAVSHLIELGFDEPVVEAEVTEDNPGPGGADRVRLLFASNRRLIPGEVGKTASGGELSRLVLSLRLAARGENPVATLAFDEIDAGVGGATALQLGRKLGDLAAQHQVLCVTHLPQVAAFADSHFVVERSGNTALISEVEGERRIAEISRMLAGLPDSTRGQEAAAELVAMARAGRNEAR